MTSVQAPLYPVHSFSVTEWGCYVPSALPSSSAIRVLSAVSNKQPLTNTSTRHMIWRIWLSITSPDPPLEKCAHLNWVAERVAKRFLAAAENQKLVIKEPCRYKSELLQTGDSPACCNKKSHWNWCNSDWIKASLQRVSITEIVPRLWSPMQTNETVLVGVNSQVGACFLYK